MRHCLGYIFLVITIITWGMMDVIHAFLEEKDYHDKGLSWIVSAQTFPIKAVGLIVLISCLLGVNFFYNWV